jgi:hypothetical protein
VRGPNADFEEGSVFVQERRQPIAGCETTESVLPVVSVLSAALSKSFLLAADFVGDIAKR